MNNAAFLFLTLLSSIATAECPEGSVCSDPPPAVEEAPIPQPEPPAMPPPIVVPVEQPLFNYQRPPSPPLKPTPEPTPVPVERLRHLGLAPSLGVPDGAGLDVVFRPYRWVRVAGGGTYNYFSTGVHGGVTVLPFKRILGLAVEAGHSFDGNVNARFKSSAPVLDAVGYSYYNLQGGLDLGRKYATFFLHVGESYIYGNIHNLNQQLKSQATFTSDPTVKAWVPSVKLGLIVWIW